MFEKSVEGMMNGKKDRTDAQYIGKQIFQVTIREIS